MSIVPRYNLPDRTEVTLYDHKMALRSTTDQGYEFMDVETGEVSITSFSKFAELLKSPVMRVENQNVFGSNVVELRHGNLKAAEQFAVLQQEMGQFHHAISSAAATLRTKHRQEIKNPKFDLTAKFLDQPENRKFICQLSSQILGVRVNSARIRGGKNVEWVLYKGRSILKYLAIYDSLDPDDDAIAALATRDHLKGNQTRRIPMRLLSLMTDAWEEIGLDLKGTSAANVHTHLETLVNEENKIRKRNDLKPLIIPSQKTLTVHREFLLSPSEYIVAVKGGRTGRGKRGRGSTDFRALFPGELVEIDECKISLISSAKERGYWENLSAADKKAVEEIEGLIRRRLTLLVMIDVATRMPLAWVLSDQPKAEATLALFRMATRDKTKEKVKFGCEADPAPEMGLGSVKSDNGSGLRNKKVIQALLGTTATFTAVRTYASADKPYVERVFGTTESVLLKLIHGYTGRKAGDLPGYDAKANGVLNIKELYGILTRFFVDEYPSMRHMGIGMGGRRPIEVLKELNETRRLFKTIDEDVRRIHLGWKVEVTPNDEGVCVFSGIWYNSDALQRIIDDYPKTKIAVFVDPENVNSATAVIPGISDILRLQLQVTAYADLTVPEVLELTQAYRKEAPEITEIHEDRLAFTRRQRNDLLKEIGVEHKLSRSYSTFEECINKARAVFGGARIVPSYDNGSTVRPGAISSSISGPGIFQIGDGGAIIEHEPADPAHATIEGETDVPETEARSDDDVALITPSKITTKSPENKQLPIGRPKTKGSFA